MKRLILALFIAVTGLALAATAQAIPRSITGTMNVSTTILVPCTVSTAPLNFGGYDGSAAKYVNSTITVNCPNGTPYRIDIDKGFNTIGTSGNPRRVKTGTATATLSNTILYLLYKTTNFVISDEWGDNGATYCTTCPTVPTGKSATGTGADQVHTVYGVLWTTTTAGTYSDTVVVTVNY